MTLRSVKKIQVIVLCAFAALAVFSLAPVNVREGIASAQEPVDPPPPLASLKTMSVPEPSNLGEFVKDRPAAIALGKALFWDMQLGSDGITSCATCHFSAGADTRVKNQLSPGLLRVSGDRSPAPDSSFNTGEADAPNYKLKSTDYPFHKLADVNDRNSIVVSDTNDVASSQGVFNTKFLDVTPGQAEDEVTHEFDPVFNVNGINVRRVEPRNTPTMINAVFNFRNFWDGRAQNIFNGVNPFGLRDPHAKVIKARTPSQLEEVRISLKDSSLASQAVGPPLSSFEMSADGRTFQEVGDKFGDTDQDKSAAKGKKLPRKTAKKLLPLRPLGKQLVHLQDSVLGSLSRTPQQGLKTATYQQMIQAAFKDEWWNANRFIQIGPNGERIFINRGSKPDGSLTTDEYTLMEYNFSLFFGLAVQMYEATLISSETSLDKFFEGNTNALTAQQKRGKEIFENQGKCIQCHNGAVLTNATVEYVRSERLERMIMGNDEEAVYDAAFYNIGVRPTKEDLGVGDKDPFGNPLSESRVAQAGLFRQLLGEEPNISVPFDKRIAADGAFKVPTLRNVELTAPYFHNGGQLTLEQVVAFYNRGGDRRGERNNDTTGFPPNRSNLDPDIERLGLSAEQQKALVAFLKSLTDERVRNRRAPFDHPQLFVPNGHPVDDKMVIIGDGSGAHKAKDELIEIPAVGRNGGAPLETFKQNLAP